MARKCIVCGNEYSYCRTCPKDAKKESWYALYDNENCKNISQALTDYNFKRITKEEAKDALAKCDLSIKLGEYYRTALDLVMSKPKRGARAKLNIVDEAISEKLVEDIQEELNGVVIEE